MNRPDIPGNFSAGKSIRLPLTIRDDEDLAGLVQWFRRLCSNDFLRKYFVEGAVDLDVRLATKHSSSDSAEKKPTREQKETGAAAPARMSVTETVVTEAVLRRYGQGIGSVTLILGKGTIVTPAARDYAKAGRIRLERSDS